MMSNRRHNPANELNRPDLYNLASPGAVLSAFFSWKRNCNSSWTLGVFARKVKLTNTGTLVNLMSGRRIPSTEMAAKIAEALEFTDAEMRYWLTLVELFKTGISEIAEIELRKKLNELRPKHHARQLTPEEFKTISGLASSAVRELVVLQDFIENEHWMLTRLMPNLNLNKQKLLKVLESLLNSGLLRRTTEGHLVQGQSVYETPKEMPSDSVKAHHEEAIEHARKSIWETPPELRHLSTLSFPMRSEDLPKLKEHIQDFTRKTIDLFGSQNSDQVYQLSLQLVPLTRNIPK